MKNLTKLGVLLLVSISILFACTPSIQANNSATPNKPDERGYEIISFTNRTIYLVDALRSSSLDATHYFDCKGSPWYINSLYEAHPIKQKEMARKFPVNDFYQIDCRS